MRISLASAVALRTARQFRRGTAVKCSRHNITEVAFGLHMSCPRLRLKGGGILLRQINSHVHTALILSGYARRYRKFGLRQFQPPLCGRAADLRSPAARPVPARVAATSSVRVQWDGRYEGSTKKNIAKALRSRDLGSQRNIHEVWHRCNGRRRHAAERVLCDPRVCGQLAAPSPRKNHSTP